MMTSVSYTSTVSILKQNPLIQWHTQKFISGGGGLHQEFFSGGVTPGFFPRGGYTRNFFQGEVHQIQLRIEGRENGDLGALAP
jgi:hypothetical protein